MPTVVTINRPDVVALIEQAANKLTAGNKTEAVSLGMRRLLAQHARAGSLFGIHPKSVRVREGVDLVTTGLEDTLDAATGHEIKRRPMPSFSTPTLPCGWTAAISGCVRPRAL
ncbi:MAG TPA: hypothetical protein VFE41_29470 [Acetobacteraceae bacterium]|nr:hypothetical protein [Acetobacteraceae bacterium]